MVIKKIIRPFVLKPWYAKKGFPVFIIIKYSESGRLTISGVEGPRLNGNSRGGAGQIDSNYDKETGRYLSEAAEIKFAPGWTNEKWIAFLKCWDEWHLNDMRPGCQHQRELGWTWQYDAEAPCPVCGYKFGTAWLKEEVPQAILEFLNSLPDSDETPVWI